MEPLTNTGSSGFSSPAWTGAAGSGVEVATTSVGAGSVSATLLEDSLVLNGKPQASVAISTKSTGKKIILFLIVVLSFHLKVVLLVCKY